MKTLKLLRRRDIFIAQQFLGECYTFGQGTEQNLEAAAEWYLKAAMRGSLEAQVNLGICYSQGMGVEQDYAEAVKWFQSAADADHPAGKMNLAISYFEGRQ